MRNEREIIDTGVSQKYFPLKYFGLVFVLTVPIWLIGGKPLPVPVNLPFSALSTFIPMIAALILSYQQSGSKGAVELLKRAVDHHKIRKKKWYLPALLLAPLIYISSYAVMRMARLPLPDPNIPLLTIPVFFLVYFICDIGEELGWTGYAIEPLQNRWGVLKASLLLGMVWALWHSIAFIQTKHSAAWVIWQCIKTVGMRVILVWLYNSSGKSVFAAILYHTADNVSWSVFPYYGSHYNPFVTGLITWLTAGILVFGWAGKRRALYNQASIKR